MRFQLKLLLGMVLLVLGIAATTLFITESQVRRSYERHFQQSFRFQVDSFLQERATRLEPVKERVSIAAASPRLLAAMENADQEHPEQRDIDDLYQNGFDQLSDLLAPADARTNHGFCFFVDSKGRVLYPSTQLKLPFSLAALRPIAGQLERAGAALSQTNQPQVGYFALEDQSSVQIRETVLTPIADRVTRQKLGVLGVGLQLPLANKSMPMLSAILLDNRLYSSSLPKDVLSALENVLRPELASGTGLRRDVTFPVDKVAHQVYCQALSTGAGFPPAYQVCLYSLAEAAAEKQSFTRKILLSASLASLGALVLSWLMSRSLAVPLQQLMAATSQIEQGNHTVKVPVRSRDEIGRLAHAFNAMSEQIRSSYAALEKRIAERTHELAERKRAEEALRSEASLREAQRIAHLGNWEWNVASNQLRWSEEVYSIFGVQPEQFGATYESFLERVHPADREKVELGVREALDTGSPYSLEHRVTRPDGQVRIVRAQGEVFRDESGRTVRMVGTIQDVTEQKRIEAEFFRAQRMDSIGAIAGGMAHDLNNALSPILMGIQIIRKKVSEPEIEQMLSVMETNTHRGADMVRQVLTFARGRDGESEPINPGQLLREMENILRQTMPKSINVQAFVPPDLWPVAGNATQVHQAMLNLCVNARDAMPNGGTLTLAADNVELSAEEAQQIPEARPGAYVTLVVADTGVGIPPEMMPRLFEPFFTTKAPGKGTGLGLSTITRILRNHGGFLGVKSEVGAGTSFDIYLPRAEVVPSAARTEAVASVVLPTGRGELVLFIDDDQSVREMVSPILVEHGYRVLTAANGVEALSLLEQHVSELRVVVTDIAMPLMDGLEILRQIHTRRPEIPVVLMSGTIRAGSTPLPPGAAGFLMKPFRVEQLLTVIAEALGPVPVANRQGGSGTNGQS